MDIDDEWNDFIDNADEILDNERNNNNIINIPKCGEIYISTKTKIIYLTSEIDIYDIFWKIPIMSYDNQGEGIIKKQIKLSTTDKEESHKIDKYLENEKLVNNKIINYIDNPNGRIKFKDIRKISIGLSKKDLLYSRVKDKSAFYNCFVISLRILYNSLYREFHIKIFNTGKLEIPGLQNDEMLFIIINKTENVLINSNFNCGFYIDRERLFNILRHKYSINACYDPCSYPGIQCVYYYDIKTNNNITNTLSINKKNINKDILKISYMIFRTGSILIVGKCNEEMLINVYNYIKNILYEEYENICILNIDKTNKKEEKKIKQKKRIIYVN